MHTKTRDAKKLRGGVRAVIACIIAFAVVFTQIKVEAFAEEVVKYWDRERNEQVTLKTEDVTAVTGDMTTLGDANSTAPKWYVVKGDVTVNERINMAGNVHLILADNSKLDAKKGIAVLKDNSLTIYGENKEVTTSTGKIIAEGDNGNAGIGGNLSKDTGNIKITGGKIDASSKKADIAQYGRYEESGAGIGSGLRTGDGGGSPFTIEITGGEINAKAHSGGGIGNNITEEEIGTIEIKGGKITARSEYGAGIGSNSSDPAGNIKITGGEISSSSFRGAGIGGGDGQELDSICTIEISGGIVEAISDKGDGIGIGKCNNDIEHEPKAGVFTTGENGKAIIKALTNRIEQSTNPELSKPTNIRNRVNESSWKGIIFEENIGKVYGDHELGWDLTVTDKETLTVPADTVLTIPEGKTLTLNGTLSNSGKIRKYGTITNEGKVSGTGKFLNTRYDEPVAVRDFKSGKLTGLDANLSYVITPEDGIEKTVNNPAEGKIDIADEWFGKTLSIKVKEDEEKLESQPQNLSIEARAEAPEGLKAEKESVSGRKDGKITGTTDKMQYRFSASAEWKTCSEGAVISLAPGKYLVRITATDTTFASKSAEIEIMQGESIGGGYWIEDPSSQKNEKDDKNKIENTDKASAPEKAEVSIEAKKGKNKTATAKISEKTVEDAITKALEEAKKNGKEAEKISLEVKVDMPKGTDKVKVNLTEGALETLTSEKINNFIVDSPLSRTVFDKKAISELKKKSKGSIVLNVTPVKKLSKNVKKLTGNRPVYDISISYAKGKKNIKALGKGSIKASIPYKLKNNEKADGLYAFYLDKKGKVRKIKGSYYDKESGAMVFSTKRLDVFGIGYTTK